MAVGDFLRALYDDKDVTWYLDDRYRIGSRKFVYEDSELKVVFTDRDGEVLWRAYVDFNIMSDPNIELYVDGSKVKDVFVSKDKMDRILEDYRKEIGSIPADKKDGTKKKADDKKKDKADKKEDETRENDNANGNGSDGGGIGWTPEMGGTGAIPGILCVCAFLGVVLNIIYSKIYSYIDVITHYGGIVCVYASCP